MRKTKSKGKGFAITGATAGPSSKQPSAASSSQLRQFLAATQGGGGGTGRMSSLIKR